MAVRARGVRRPQRPTPAARSDRRPPDGRRHLLLRPEEGRRGRAAASLEPLPPRDLLGLPDHHDRDRRRRGVGRGPERVARAAPRPRLPPAVHRHRPDEPRRAARDRLGVHPPHRREARADPDEPRRRPHPRRYRLADGHALLVPRLPDRRRGHARRRHPLVAAGIQRDRHLARADLARARRPRLSRRLLAARADPADVPQLPALLQTHSPARCAAEHPHAQPQRAAHGPAEDRSRGRHPVGRWQVRAVLVEEPARYLRVHRVRALLELLPGVRHRQEPVADAARARHPLRDAGPHRATRRDRRPRARRRQPRGLRDDVGHRPPARPRLHARAPDRREARSSRTCRS